MKPEQLEELLRYRMEQAHETLREANIAALSRSCGAAMCSTPHRRIPGRCTGPSSRLEYVESLKPVLFEMELEAWNLDPATWPAERTNQVFDAWFELEVHSMVWDSVDTPIEKE